MLAHVSPSGSHSALLRNRNSLMLTQQLWYGVGETEDNSCSSLFKRRRLLSLPPSSHCTALLWQLSIRGCVVNSSPHGVGVLVLDQWWQTYGMHAKGDLPQFLGHSNGAGKGGKVWHADSGAFGPVLGRGTVAMNKLRICWKRASARFWVYAHLTR